MNRFSLKENKEFILNTVAIPLIINTGDYKDIELFPDLNLVITQENRTIVVKDTVFKSCILPTLGISSLLKKTMLSDTILADNILDLIRPILFENLSHFIFFVDSDSGEAEAIVVSPLFDKDLEPIIITNNSPELRNYLCTSHLPVDSNVDYDVVNFLHDISDKKFKLSLSRPSDEGKEIYPVVHNTAPVSWKEKWDQRVSLYVPTYDLYMTLPRNYGKPDYRYVELIFKHVDALISKVNLNDSYEKEFDDMLMAKLPSAGHSFFMDNVFVNKDLRSVLEKVSSIKREGMVKSNVINAIYKCLGYMVAQKVHCCPECRHLDTDTL